MKRNSILYVASVLIWGTTWLGIKFQLGVVDPMVSVVYRFSLAAVILLAFCRVTRLKMQFSPMDHLFMGLQGIFLFAVNYWLFYLAEMTLASGLAAVVFSTIVFMNIINGKILLGSPLHPAVIIGSVMGSVGIGLVFWPELNAFTLSDKTFLGLVLCICATFFASVGNIISARNQKHRLPIIQTNAFGMAYGAVIMIAIALGTGKPFGFEPSFAYIGSLFYLAVFGSIVAFGCYLSLIGRIGADRAAYSTMLIPLVALGLSTLFEGYRWSEFALTGMALILAGNVLVLNKKAAAFIGIYLVKSHNVCK